MNTVSAPLENQGGALPKSANRFVIMMQAGQIVMAILLTAFGAARSVKTEISLAVALAVALVLIIWQLVGVALPALRKSADATKIWLLVFFALWIIAVAVSAEFVWLAFLLWLLAGHLLRLSSGILFSSLVFVVVAVAPILHHGTTTYANIFGPFIGAVFAFGISRGYLQLLKDAIERESLLKSLTAANEKASQLQLEVALAQRHSGVVQERTRISRDIHDTVAQSLSSIRLLAHASVNSVSNTPRSNTETLRQVEQISGEALSDVRRIIAALAPSELETGNLKSALNHLIEKLAVETGAKTRVHFDDLSGNLSEEAEIAVLRATQSAFANIKKHASPTLIAVTLTDAGDEIRLDIIDNGKGFDATSWEENHKINEESFGLRFMRERLQELGGGLEISSHPGEGTSVSMFLPTKRKNENT